MTTFRFRLPFWYKLLFFFLWVASFNLTLYLFSKPLHPVMKYPLFVADLLFGAWVVSLFKLEVVVDTEEGFVKLGRKILRIEEILEVRARWFTVTILTKDQKVLVFPHCLENVEILKELVEKKESGKVETG